MNKVCECGQSFDDHKNNKCDLIYKHVEQTKFRNQGLLALTFTKDTIIQVGDAYMKLVPKPNGSGIRILISAEKHVPVNRYSRSGKGEANENKRCKTK